MVLSVHGLVYAQRKLLLHLLRVTCGSPQMYSYCQIPHVLHLRSRSCKMSRLSWSPLEDAALRRGVLLYGEGSWQAIVKDVRLARRSNVAAKDRWRILKRQAGMSSFLLRLFVSFFLHHFTFVDDDAFCATLREPRHTKKQKPMLIECCASGVCARVSQILWLRLMSSLAVSQLI